MITVIPAIDLKGGKCVRLQQGRADDQTVYGDDPVAMAKHWEDQGAQWLHVVDLDGAFEGHPVHQAIVEKIARAISIPVEIGGGLRTRNDIQTLLEAGIERVIIGTKACENPETIGALAEEYGSHLAVGIDARDGIVQIRGWVEDGDMKADELARCMESAGVETLIFTDTATDGMMTGTNVKAMDEMCKAVSCSIVASGGIRGASDVADLAALRNDNLVGAIVGKALYDDATTLRELMDAV